jgi:hypothetical protein
LSDDPDKALEELRRLIASEGLPRLSQDALRAAKLNPRERRLIARPEPGEAPKLSDEARRLYLRKSDPEWPWRRS